MVVGDDDVVDLALVEASVHKLEKRDARAEDRPADGINKNVLNAP